MSICNSSVDFDNSEDWELVVTKTVLAEVEAEIIYKPIPAFDLEVSLSEKFVAISVQSTESRPTWRFGGEIRQSWGFTKGSEISTPFGKALTSPVFLPLNRVQTIELNRYDANDCRLVYLAPKWFKDVTVYVWKYTGSVTNFVADTLFDIGNKVGAGTLNESSNIPNLIASQQSELEAIKAQLADLIDLVGNTSNSTVSNTQIQQLSQNVIQNVQQTNQQITELSNNLSSVLSGNSDPNVLGQPSNQIGAIDEFI